MKDLLSTSTEGIKRFILDTNVLVDDPESPEKFEENDVHIPIFSIGELDEMKNERSSRGQAARKAGRLIDGYTERGAANGGAKSPGGGRIFVISHTVSTNKVNLPNNTDGKIIGAALYLQRREKEKVILVSKDFNMRSMARACGLIAQDYTNPRKVVSIDDLTNGLAEFDLRGDDLDLMRQVHQHGQIPAGAVFEAFGQQPDLHPNTCCIFRKTEGRREGVFYAVYKKQRGIFVNVPYEDPDLFPRRTVGLRPKTWEQAFALHLARDPEISLLAFRGPAGTGKTLMALYAGYEEVMKGSAGNFRQMVIYRPYVEAGEKLGAMPGPLSAKFAEFMVPITDNLGVIIDENNGFHHAGREEDRRPQNHKDRRRQQRQGQSERRGGDELRDTIRDLITEGPIEISPINFARGRSLNDTMVIADESQNYNRRQAKLVVTRAGRNAKVIFTGDHTQIDVPHLDEVTCGISHVVASMQGEEIFAHLTMNIAVRSELAEISGRRM